MFEQEGQPMLIISDYEYFSKEKELEAQDIIKAYADTVEIFTSLIFELINERAVETYWKKAKDSVETLWHYTVALNKKIKTKQKQEAIDAANILIRDMKNAGKAKKKRELFEVAMQLITCWYQEKLSQLQIEEIAKEVYELVEESENIQQ